MREEIRRAIVANAAVQITGKACSSVFSHDRCQHSPMTPTYDFEAGAHISGTASNLYHYGRGSLIQLNIDGQSFEGVDHSEGHRFSGSVDGNRVQIYDYGEGRSFDYWV